MKTHHYGALVMGLVMPTILASFSPIAHSQQSQVVLDPLSQTGVPKSYAIASLIGDKVSVVLSQMQTGTMLDPNRKASIDLPEQGLDGDIMMGVQQVIKKQCTACKTLMLKVKPVESPEDGEKLLPGLLGAAQRAKVDRLLVLTKYRDDARLTFEGVKLGQGKLVGMGFFVDTSKRVRNANTLETASGYLAPYAYFKLHVIDVVSGDIIYSHGLTTSTTYSVTQKGDFDVWNAVPAERKVPVLLSLVQLEIERVLVPNLLGLAP
jgi:hypothetical protein